MGGGGGEGQSRGGARPPRGIQTSQIGGGCGARVICADIAGACAGPPRHPAEGTAGGAGRNVCRGGGGGGRGEAPRGAPGAGGTEWVHTVGAPRGAEAARGHPWVCRRPGAFGPAVSVGTRGCRGAPKGAEGHPRACLDPHVRWHPVPRRGTHGCRGAPPAVFKPPRAPAAHQHLQPPPAPRAAPVGTPGTFGLPGGPLAPKGAAEHLKVQRGIRGYPYTPPPPHVHRHLLKLGGTQGRVWAPKGPSASEGAEEHPALPSGP